MFWHLWLAALARYLLTIFLSLHEKTSNKQAFSVFKIFSPKTYSHKIVILQINHLMRYLRKFRYTQFSVFLIEFCFYARTQCSQTPFIKSSVSDRKGWLGRVGKCTLYSSRAVNRRLLVSSVAGVQKGQLWEGHVTGRLDASAASQLGTAFEGSNSRSGLTIARPRAVSELRKVSIRWRHLSNKTLLSGIIADSSRNEGRGRSPASCYCSPVNEVDVLPDMDAKKTNYWARVAPIVSFFFFFCFMEVGKTRSNKINQYRRMVTQDQFS